MRFGTLLRSLLVIMALAVGAQTVSAQEQVVVTGDNVRLAQQPTFDSPGTPVAKGTSLMVLERNGDWIRVYDGRNQGFIHKAFVGGAAAAAPAPAPQYQSAPQPSYPPQQQAFPPQMFGGAPQPNSVRQPGMPGYKDPSTAMLFSAVVIGGGQFYAGETSKGLMLAGVGYGAPILAGMVVASSADDCYNDIYSGGNYDSCYDVGGMSAVVYGAWAVTLGSWIYGILTADDAAIKANSTPFYGLSPMIGTDGKQAYAGIRYTFGR